VYNGVEYYEVDGVYFYVQPGLFKDISDISYRFINCAANIKNRPICIFRCWGTGELVCEYDFREDCDFKKTIDGVDVFYREQDIDFANKNVLGFVKQCLKERHNYNVVCYLNEGVDDDKYSIREDLTLFDFFRRYCKSN
jgi:hypothetical protein